MSKKQQKIAIFFVKIDFLSPNSAQSPPHFQIFTFSTHKVNVLLWFQELYHFSEKWTLTGHIRHLVFAKIEIPINFNSIFRHNGRYYPHNIKIDADREKPNF